MYSYSVASDSMTKYLLLIKALKKHHDRSPSVRQKACSDGVKILKDKVKYFFHTINSATFLLRAVKTKKNVTNAFLNIYFKL